MMLQKDFIFVIIFCNEKRWVQKRKLLAKNRNEIDEEQRYRETEETDYENFSD